MRRAVALAVTVALLATGCTQSGSKTAGPKTSSPTSTGPASAAPAVAASEAAASQPGVAPVAATTPGRLSPATLATAGIATVADETTKAPLAPVTGPTVLTLTSWQVTNMGTETAGHGGISGADLDAMLPMPSDAPQLADVVGGWVISNIDPAAVAAGTLLGSPDWTHPEQVLFPTAVLTMFIADLLAHQASSATTPTAATTSGTALQSHVVINNASLITAPCTTVTGFVDRVLDTIFGLLKVNEAEVSAYVSGQVGGVVGALLGAAAGFLAGFWNHAVDLAEQAVKSVLKSLTQPVLNALALVIGGVAVISMIRSYLTQWTMTVNPDPAGNAFSVDPKPYNSGSFSITIDRKAEISDWPPQFVDCAAAADVKLPTLASAGSPVTWTVTEPEPLVTTDPVHGVLDQDLKNTIGYKTGHESAKLAKTGAVVTPTVHASVKVRRTEVEQLRQFVTTYLTGKVPDVVAPVVNPILAGYIELATQYLDDITAVTGSTTIVVSHHVPKPTPTPTAPTCAGSGTAIPAGTYIAHVKGVITTSLHFSGQISADGSGSQTVAGTIHLISDGHTVTGAINAGGSGSSKVGLQGTVQFEDSAIGKMVGTISGTASAPMASGTLSGTDEVGGPVSAPFQAGLHLTQIGCSSISGDMVAMFREIEAPNAKYLTIGGSAAWTAPRS
jgi:hypothetical protein